MRQERCFGNLLYLTQLIELAEFNFHPDNLSPEYAVTRHLLMSEVL